MRGKNRNPIEEKGKLPQFTTMHVIEGQAGQINYTSLIFYSLTFNNILNIIVMLILVAVTITMAVNGGLFGKAADAGRQTNEAVRAEQQLGNGVIKIKDGSTIYEYENINAYFTNTPSKVYEEDETLDNSGENEDEGSGDEATCWSCGLLDHPGRLCCKYCKDEYTDPIMSDQFYYIILREDGMNDGACTSTGMDGDELAEVIKENYLRANEELWWKWGRDLNDEDIELLRRNILLWGRCSFY